MSEFRLVDFLDDPSFNGLRFDMGATLVARHSANRTIRLLDEDAIRRLGQDGIEIGSWDEISVEPDDTLSYRGKRVVIYIRDVQLYHDNYSLPKFHLVYCATLQNMRRQRRWHRYVVANRDDGYFSVNFVGDHTSKVERLAICQNCLSGMGWDEFSSALSRAEKQEIVAKFSIQQFFERYPKDLISVLPSYSADLAPLNDYSADWGMLSERAKHERGYSCERCGVRLVGVDRKYLHVHHVNGDRSDNSSDNLEVLCIRCHSEQPMHIHLRNGFGYQEYVRRFGDAII